MFMHQIWQKIVLVPNLPLFLLKLHRIPIWQIRMVVPPVKQSRPLPTLVTHWLLHSAAARVCMGSDQVWALRPTCFSYDFHSHKLPSTFIRGRMEF